MESIRFEKGEQIMENEVKELLDDELNNELGKVNRKASKGMILGITAVAVSALLFRFRNKINTKIEGSMVRKLSKKGYTVLEPVATTELTDKIDDALLENL